MHPPYYRGCWHGVSRCLFLKYRQNFFLEKRGLQTKILHPSRGIAPSGFRPLRKIPHCCLPEESGPCLSPSVADRPLRPATRRCLGEPLPHQLADRPRDPPRAPEHFFTRPCDHVKASGISRRFQRLSRSLGQVSHVLLTRSPLSPGASSGISFDLHVLGTPPAFVLSQDQTLRRDLGRPEGSP